MSFWRGALLAPANVLGLLSAGTAAAVTGHLAPLAVAAGVEAFYLVLVAAVPGLRRRVGRGVDASPAFDEAEALLTDLAPNQRAHYESLRGLKESIEANYRKLPGGRVLAAASEQRVDALLTSFLRLLSTLNAYRKHLSVADRQALERELSELRADIDAETQPRLREVKERRRDILGKRLQRFTQAEESRAVVSHQLASIEDLLRLTHEQSIAIRDPESVTGQLDALAAEVAVTEESVRDMERFLELAEETALPLTHRSRIR